MTTANGEPLASNAPVWGTGTAPLRLPALRGEVSAEFCVVGLGGSGLAAVLELLALGKRVVGVDAAEVAGGAAGRNGGFLLAGLAPFHHDAVAAYGRERAARLYRLTMEEIDRITAETPEAVRRVGSLRVGVSPDELDDCRAQLAAMRADGLPVETYEGREGRGLKIPTDGAFEPVGRCRALARSALTGGARLFEQSPAVNIAGDVVETPDGRVHCKRVIVAVDGRLELVIPELADRVRTARLQMLATAPTDEIRVPRPVYARWGYDYWQQLPDGTLTLGGFRDRAEAAEWTRVAEPAAPIQDHLERFLRNALGVRAPITHRWAASVGYTKSELPIVEEVRPNVWVTGGYCGTGNVVGAMCARAVAQVASGGASEVLDLIRG